ncbi:MAG: ribonucleoside-triphosphate reductase [Candidatus Taylorbacteria bacterium RIFCSPLOWO2_12_FULL_43_20]|uniref:Ribonucleoside-triphosphate reductase n=1 Tax=Candidatus Taylorbacteria bacterium RIFCSPLOWO2_12_FULL_43_20 TaxID=1802332 RepID=A0A1G2P3W4_9BACT|nr:MAG: ribonucleoside-triphosphate reductase [Candidatus Taylorbacteria bacterium RIFCSPHIGHO2_01_FULL_43_120]OHA22827.1 MAG: ribonucleoside-triphosphate reductase [Candidatus Taylorbacteria bacterium RIFCSPHIGHO2_02_FULL_43_55]OHA29392.1 MAG: ribonucleoside-triphosphate reductase [Candidatus Taylorbacteria bacterium RIFCSPHIGHO2_12_FULL_42_34]OHA31768.1 MAG: ribonucleoside-triphosphate reductase [Candidatus Taylorbacteria bacterium RIFCSPLOWO2_01_FULL_43_83]OHA38583.1 MAG: ribonucleoside-trip
MATKKQARNVEVKVKTIQKRDGTFVPFDISKIATAINKSMIATGEGSPKEAELVANKVYADVLRITRKYKNFIPTVEGVQDTVEKELILSEYVKTAKSYILYREKRAKLREQGVRVPPKVKKMAEESKKYFRNSLGEFVYYRTYSRWMEEEQRRETWIETVDRYIGFMKENLGNKLKESEYKEIREGILKQEAMPSMRLLQFAGKAARATNVCAYNCSYIAPENFQDMAEIMYVSMCGTGAGWSVESQNVQKFPQIMMQTGEKLPTHVISDDKEGWSDAFVFGMKTWASGKDVDFDFSLLRPAGTRLKTMGGKASGPDPLRRLLSFTREKMLTRQGKRLRNIDVHDIICMIGDCVVSGGVRRSAMISLSDLDDDDIRDAKKGAFYNSEPQRMLANNSAVYMQKPSNSEFMEEWISLMKSGSGERGIFNRGSLAKTLPERRIQVLKQYKGYFDASGNNIIGSIGTNPCGEIILQSKQFCNLSEIVARSDDTEKTLLEKMRIATILGTYQASLTHFPYISKGWQENCDKERLLGVSITGQWDCPAVCEPKMLAKLKKEAIKINQIYAKRMNISASTCITCVKPSGTLSQTVDCSSGMHPRHAPYYIRRIRISATDSLFKMLKDQGVPYHPEIGQSKENATTYVLEFPVKAPPGSIFKNDLTAIDQLEHWKLVKTNYTEHNPSVTVSVGENEWIEVANWVYANWDIVGGLSFLPRDNHIYPLAPYETIDEKKYKELSERLAHVDYSKIITYEKTDDLDVKKELACMSGVCEVV